MKVGDLVERQGSSKDYTTGRKGIIVEEAKIDDRVRVRWIEEKEGALIDTMNAKPGNGVRTWVNRKFLKYTALHFVKNYDIFKAAIQKVN